MILAGLRAPFVRDRAWRTVSSAGATGIAELRDAHVDRVIDLELDRRNHAAHAEQRAERWMDDRPVPAQLAESRFEADRNVQQIAVADRMFDLACVADRSKVGGELNHRLAEREVHAQALDR